MYSPGSAERSNCRGPTNNGRRYATYGRFTCKGSAGGKPGIHNAFTVTFCVALLCLRFTCKGSTGRKPGIHNAFTSSGSTSRKPGIHAFTFPGLVEDLRDIWDEGVVAERVVQPLGRALAAGWFRSNFLENFLLIVDRHGCCRRL